MKPMTFERQRDIAIRLASAAGIARWSIAPAPWRLLWRHSVEIPPPVFMSAQAEIVGFVGLFALLWAPIGLLALAAPSLAAVAPFAVWVGAGVAFGVGSATLHAVQRHCLGLPEWVDLPKALVFA